MYKPSKQEKDMWCKQMSESLRKAAADKNIEVSPEELWVEIKDARMEDTTGSLERELNLQRFDKWELTVSIRFNAKKLKAEDARDILKIAGEKYGVGAYSPEFGRFVIENNK